MRVGPFELGHTVCVSEPCPCCVSDMQETSHAPASAIVVTEAQFRRALADPKIVVLNINAPSIKFTQVRGRG